MHSVFFRIYVASVLFGKLIVQKIKPKITNIFTIVLALSFFSSQLVYNNNAVGWENFENPQYSILATLIVIILLLFSNLFKFQNIYFNGVDKTVALFGLYIFLQGFYSDEIFLGSESHLYLFSALIFYFLSKFSISHLQHLIYICLTLLVIGALLSLFAISQAFVFQNNFNHLAVSGFFSNSGVLAGYLTSIIPMSWGMQFMEFSNSKTQKRVKHLSQTASMVMIITVTITYSRSAYVTLILIFFTIYINHRLRNNKPVIKPLLIFSLLFTVAFFTLLYIKYDSVIGRILVWKVSVRIFLNNFLFGVGFGNFEIEYLNYQSRYFSENHFSQFSKVAGNTYYAFNELLKIAVELGIIGALLFGILIRNIIKTSNSRYRNSSNWDVLSYYLKFSILAILLFGMFSYPFSIQATFLNLIFYLATISKLSDDYSKISKINTPIKSIFVMVGLIFCSIVVKKIFNNISAIHKWRRAASLSVFDNQNYISKYEEVYPILNKNGEFLFNFGAVLSEKGEYNKSLEILNRAKIYFNHIDLHLFLGNTLKGLGKFQAAENSYIFASNMIPTRFVPKYLLFILHQETNQKNNAIRVANQILDMEVKIESPISSQIKSEVRQFLDSQ